MWRAWHNIISRYGPVLKFCTSFIPLRVVLLSMPDTMFSPPNTGEVVASVCARIWPAQIDIEKWNGTELNGG